MMSYPKQQSILHLSPEPEPALQDVPLSQLYDNITIGDIGIVSIGFAAGIAFCVWAYLKFRGRR